MAEGVALAGGGVAAGIHDDPGAEPAAGPDAPRGWVWNRKASTWQPRRRGAVIWSDPAAVAPGPAADAGARESAGLDPEPSWMRPDAKGSDKPRRVPWDQVPQRVKDDAAGLAGIVGAPLLALLQRADPYCGTALAENYEPIVDATLPLLLRSERVIRYFRDDQADWLLWGKLALALRPVAIAVIEHHITRTIVVERDADGQVTISRPAAPGGDPLAPPVPDYVA